MTFIKPRLALALSALVAACGTVNPPESKQLVRREAMGPGHDVLLLVDTCLSKSPLVGDDYVVVSNSKTGAKSISNVVQEYLKATGVSGIVPISPFVCGADRAWSKSQLRPAAENIDGQVTNRSFPIGPDLDFAKTSDFTDALGVVSSSVYRKALIAATAKSDKNNAQNGAIDATSEASLRAATNFLLKSTGATSLIYVGAAGSSLSSGKAAALKIAQFVTAMAFGATSYSLGPAFRAVGSNYYIVYQSSASMDFIQVAAGYVDLQTGKVLRTNMIHSRIDPMQSSDLLSVSDTKLLMRELIFSNELAR